MLPKPTRLHIQEVSVRDGFQIEPIFVPTSIKVDLINALSRTRLAKIEVTSFTSPKAIPGLADAEEVLSRIDRASGVEYTALVPNVRGALRALRTGLDEFNLVMSASDTHGLANLRMTPEQSLEQFREIAQVVNGKVALCASLSTAFGCPFDGEVPVDHVLWIVQQIVDLGIQRVTLCDTTGMANPRQVHELCAQVRNKWPDIDLTGHFHNTRGMGLANAVAAMQAGVTRFDASIAGLGGCPFAPGASGNVCTEDLVHMFEAMGFDTGVNLEALLACSQRIPEIVQHDVPGQVMKAGASTRRYPAPAGLGAPGGQTQLAGAGWPAREA